MKKKRGTTNLYGILEFSINRKKQIHRLKGTTREVPILYQNNNNNNNNNNKNKVEELISETPLAHVSFLHEK